ncbi:molybdenum cofactor guanylyltransferase [Cricetibacter osteomyelitidis]|uniref:Molybdenum cofactor guanylyltransferase n=1 Tax=Cricetibacter osteomyelitidis TaxID=1521931 RepID=A0A4R2T5V4_9PAST|nr:molybdenum cofactor guanylyltransferase MobA [Cricetibacter osteomyelitidis]TCP96234.1 molybdenum cofactor guanylyltransferase [Cricetibacter osteomyelitidis]
MKFTISAVILAGGQGKRMGGVDKGLQLLQNRQLFQHVLQRLQPQINNITINANRNQAVYAQSGLPVFSDELADFQGPLSGMLSGLKQADTDFVLFVPCDCPLLPLNLLEKLQSAVSSNKVLAAYAHDGERAHPTFCLLSTQLIPLLTDYLARGERRILFFMREVKAEKVDFSAEKDGFININSVDQLSVL